MSSKKLETILSLVQVAENNLKNAQKLLVQLITEKGGKVDLSQQIKTPGMISKEEEGSMQVQEGYFDGENMVGDNGQIYQVPQNYASKTQLVVGDRMKWILTGDREVFKLIQPASRQRVTGTFNIEGENFVVLVDEFSSPIKILKASATYAMKNLGLMPGDEVAIYIPKDVVPTWGAFISVVKSGLDKASLYENQTSPSQGDQEELSKSDEKEILEEFKVLDEINENQNSGDDYF